jgi:hypothetical protein
MIEFGHGDTNNDLSYAKISDFVNEARYIDLVQELTRGDSSYTDFEGLTDSVGTRMMLADPQIVALFEPGLREPFTRDLLAHWYYANVDEGGYTPSIGECTQFVFILDWLFTSRYYMKIDAKEAS